MTSTTSSSTTQSGFPRSRESYLERKHAAIKTTMKKKARINNARQRMSQSDKYREEMIKLRKTVLNADLSAVQHAITHAGNIARDIDCIERMQDVNRTRAEAWRETFERLYGVSFEARGDVLKAPRVLVRACNMLWSTRVVYPWAEHKEAARYVDALEELVDGWETARRDGKGNGYWDLEDNVSRFKDVVEWYDYGVYGLDSTTLDQ